MTGWTTTIAISTSIVEPVCRALNNEPPGNNASNLENPPILPNFTTNENDDSDIGIMSVGLQGFCVLFLDPDRYYSALQGYSYVF